MEKITYQEYTEQMNKSHAPRATRPDVLRLDLETVPREKRGLYKEIQENERARRNIWPK